MPHPSRQRSARSSQPDGAATITAPTAGDAAAAPTATASIGRPPIDRNAFGSSAPTRRPAPAASTIATAVPSPGSMREAWQTGRERGASVSARTPPRVPGSRRPCAPWSVWITLRDADVGVRRRSSRRPSRPRPSCRRRGIRRPGRARDLPSRAAPTISSPAVYGTRNFDARALIWATGTRNASATLARLWSTVISDAPRLPGEPHERRVDVHHADLLDELELHRGRLLKLDEHVESTPATLPPARVARVADRLQLTQHPIVQQHRAAHEPGRDEVEHASVDQRARVEHVQVACGLRPRPAASCRPARRCPRASPHPAGTRANRSTRKTKMIAGPRRAARHAAAAGAISRPATSRPTRSPTTPPGDLGGAGRRRSSRSMPLDGSQGQPADDAAEHEPDGGPEEDVQQRTARAPRGRPCAEQESDRSRAAAMKMSRTPSTRRPRIALARTSCSRSLMAVAHLLHAPTIARPAGRLNDPDAVGGIGAVGRRL